jgi:branched-chain amino acid aminotransferase
VIQAEYVWLNGRLVPFAEARTHIIAFTLHYGLGVFEGLRCYLRADGRSAIFRLREHVDRFFESARVCEMDLPLSREALEAACLETVRENRLDEAYVRPLGFVGPGVLGLGARSNPVEVAVVAFAWTAVLGAEAAGKGIRAHVSSFVRGHLNASMSKAKIVGGYANSVIAKRESQRLGFDEAIMLDADGRVAEGTAENIFVVWKGTLYTPPLDMPILAGITRDAVITLARQAGLEVVERSLTRDMLLSASEVFLTGTATEVTPVREVDGRPVGDGQPGPITRRLQALFQTAARGPGEPHPEWLSYL